ncbi:MAG: hypothetical protein E2O68_05010 [Deltaproteobacteria bacterium]|nr:MAG: hypothetical protein E2O68_05010 [Deltaproteobacteria bacterium]
MNKLILLFTMSLLFSTSAFSARNIKHCGSNAESTMKDALRFLDNNINTIINNTGDLKNGEKKRLKNKLANINFKCMDHKQVCKKKATRGGKSRHLFNAAVVICYNNIRTLLQDDAFCTLADVLIHEAGHAAGVKKDWGHNNGPNNDKVYRLGYAAADLCRTKSLDRAIRLNTNN